jgi:hypothetical protein
VGGQDFAAIVDAEVGDEDCEQGLGLLGLAVGDDVLKPISDGAEGRRIRRCGRVCAKFGEDLAMRAASRADFLLTGLVRCGRCRRAYVGMSAKGNGCRLTHQPGSDISRPRPPPPPSAPGLRADKFRPFQRKNATLIKPFFSARSISVPTRSRFVAIVCQRFRS